MSAIAPTIDELLAMLGSVEPICSLCQRPIDLDLTDNYAARTWLWVGLDGTVYARKLKPSLSCVHCLEDLARRAATKEPK